MKLKRLLKSATLVCLVAVLSFAMVACGGARVVFQHNNVESIEFANSIGQDNDWDARPIQLLGANRPIALPAYVAMPKAESFFVGFQIVEEVALDLVDARPADIAGMLALADAILDVSGRPVLADVIDGGFTGTLTEEQETAIAGLNLEAFLYVMAEPIDPDGTFDVPEEFRFGAVSATARITAANPENATQFRQSLEGAYANRTATSADHIGSTAQWEAESRLGRDSVRAGLRHSSLDDTRITTALAYDLGIIAASGLAGNTALDNITVEDIRTMNLADYLPDGDASQDLHDAFAVLVRRQQYEINRLEAFDEATVEFRAFIDGLLEDLDIDEARREAYSAEYRALVRATGITVTARIDEIITGIRSYLGQRTNWLEDYEFTTDDLMLFAAADEDLEEVLERADLLVAAQAVRTAYNANAASITAREEAFENYVLVNCLSQTAGVVIRVNGVVTDVVDLLNPTELEAAFASNATIVYQLPTGNYVDRTLGIRIYDNGLVVITQQVPNAAGTALVTETTTLVVSAIGYGNFAGVMNMFQIVTR